MKKTKLSDIISLFEYTEEGCWIWHGEKTSGGYGKAAYGGKDWFVHRLMYTLFVGAIGDKLDAHHICENPARANPSHIMVTDRATHYAQHPNSLATKKKSQTHCVNGHEFTPENTYIRSSRPQGGRACRVCSKESSREYRKAKQERKVE